MVYFDVANVMVHLKACRDRVNIEECNDCKNLCKKFPVVCSQCISIHSIERLL